MAADLWALEMAADAPSLVRSESAMEMLTCPDPFPLTALAAWADGTNWEEDGAAVGWEDWPPVELLAMATGRRT